MTGVKLSGLWGACFSEGRRVIATQGKVRGDPGPGYDVQEEQRR